MPKLQQDFENYIHIEVDPDSSTAGLYTSQHETEDTI